MQFPNIEITIIESRKLKQMERLAHVGELYVKCVSLREWLKKLPANDPQAPTAVRRLSQAERDLEIETSRQGYYDTE